MRDQLLAINDKLADVHTLLILLQSRDATQYPLPGNADAILDMAEEQLNSARDALVALAQVSDEN